MRSVCSLSLELPGELLSGKSRFISTKADGGSSVELPSFASSVVSNASALFSKSLRKLKSRLDNLLSMPYRLPSQLDRDPVA